jgi:hypothetical protein
MPLRRLFLRDCAPGLAFELGSSAKGNCINAEFQNPKHECDFVLSWTLRKERYDLFALEMAADEQRLARISPRGTKKGLEAAPSSTFTSTTSFS